MWRGHTPGYPIPEHYNIYSRIQSILLCITPFIKYMSPDRSPIFGLNKRSQGVSESREGAQSPRRGEGGHGQ
jgi:hypothetical protein